MASNSDNENSKMDEISPAALEAAAILGVVPREQMKIDAEKRALED